MVSSGYPAHREADVVLRDGSTVRLRPVRPEDEAALREFFAGLDADSRAFRFFSGAVDLERAAAAVRRRRLRASATGCSRCAARTRLVGHGLYVGGRRRAGRGRLRGRRRDAGARAWGRSCSPTSPRSPHENGIADLRRRGAAAEPPDDRDVPRERLSGRDRVERRARCGSSSRPRSRRRRSRRFEDRDRLAARAAVAAFLAPRSVAVVGASRRRGTRRRRSPPQPARVRLRGRALPGQPGAPTSVQAVRAYPSVADVPGEVDLAVIAVPADAVIETSRANAAAKGARALVVLSAGFAETGRGGDARASASCWRSAARRGCGWSGRTASASSTPTPRRALNATFAPDPPPPGNVAFASQSGALGLALIEFAARAPARRLLLRLARQPRRRHRQRLARVLGGGRAHRASRCSTSSPSATRAASRGLAAGRPRASRSSRSRAAARRPARARPAPTPARCWRPPTAPSTRSSSSRA